MRGSRTDREKIAAAVAAVKAGTPRLQAAAEAGISKDVLYRALKPKPAKPAPPPGPAEPPATVGDKEVDQIVGRSRTWRRLKEVLAKALAAHPVAAADVVRALREAQL